jgi:hypothetical protein
MPFEGDADRAPERSGVFPGRSRLSVFAGVAAIELAGLLPASRLPESHGFLVAMALLLAIAQAMRHGHRRPGQRRQAADAAIEAGEAR